MDRPVSSIELRANPPLRHTPRSASECGLNILGLVCVVCPCRQQSLAPSSNSKRYGISRAPTAYRRPSGQLSTREPSSALPPSPPFVPALATVNRDIAPPDVPHSPLSPLGFEWDRGDMDSPQQLEMPDIILDPGRSWSYPSTLDSSTRAHRRDNSGDRTPKANEFNHRLQAPRSLQRADHRDETEILLGPNLALLLDVDLPPTASALDALLSGRSAEPAGLEDRLVRRKFNVARPQRLLSAQVTDPAMAFGRVR